jgi:hypothetical protein
MIRRSFLAAAYTAIVATSLGCGGGKQYWHAQPVLTPGVRIEPKKVMVWGKLLYVETDLFNYSSVPVIVHRDQVVLVLPNGAVIGRSQGTFTQHKGYVVPPGGMHAVHVDFKAEGFKWSDVQSAQVNFGPAVFVDGQPLMLPTMPVSPHAMAAAPVAPPPAAPASAPPPSGGDGTIKVQGGVDVKM